ncbi:divalent-cation tolerance protein CutA [Erythrobacter sp. MTPC3]|uniref:divalent-cation tolerance protein CutA n=1 Tax=Erythrobacter sp. MTPC3 TaxID=3056564 RepID=UPI0036F3B6CB
MTGPGAALVWCPFPDRESARAISGKLLDQKLIACANLIGEIESIFEWEGARSSDTEIGVLFKTSGDRLEDLVSVLGKLHPYDTPAIFGWPCGGTHPDTLEWLGTQLSTGES